MNLEKTAQVRIEHPVHGYCFTLPLATHVHHHYQETRTEPTPAPLDQEPPQQQPNTHEGFVSPSNSPQTKFLNLGLTSRISGSWHG